MKQMISWGAIFCLLAFVFGLGLLVAALTGSASQLSGLGLTVLAGFLIVLDTPWGRQIAPLLPRFSQYLEHHLGQQPLKPTTSQKPPRPYHWMRTIAGACFVGGMVYGMVEIVRSGA